MPIPGPPPLSWAHGGRTRDKDWDLPTALDFLLRYPPNAPQWTVSVGPVTRCHRES